MAQNISKMNELEARLREFVKISAITSNLYRFCYHYIFVLISVLLEKNYNGTVIILVFSGFHWG